MVYKNFRASIIVRIIFFGLTVFLFFFLLTGINVSMPVTVTLVGLAAVYQLYGVFKMVDRIMRHINMFFTSIRYSDFSYNVNLPSSSRVFKKLNEVFRFVIDEFKKIRDEREKQFRYLQNIVQHVGIGLLAFKENGDVDFINNAAKKIFRVAQISNVEELAAVDKELARVLGNIRNKEKRLFKMEKKEEALQLIVYATEFFIGENHYKLVSVQNIQKELEEKEIESWEKLIHVLTHEIMNSVAPIYSLASTTRSILENKIEREQNESPEMSNIHRAIQTIEKRTDGLLYFVKKFRKLTGIPKPEFTVIPIAELFQRVKDLMNLQLRERKIDFQILINVPDTKITADNNLIEQILINLIKNSIDALEGIKEPMIQLISGTDLQGHQMIQVVDNGKGIDEDNIEKVFIPFFTTKNSGTGIGLNISRQIMWMHGGTLRAKSVPGIRTTFTLVF